MGAKSRYWDHERCAWVVYEATAVPSPESLDEALPEQRVDEQTAAEAAPAP